MNHWSMTDELREKLLESAAWGKVGVHVDETKLGKGTVIEEETEEEVSEEPVVEASSEESSEEAETDVVEGAHVCPLCLSQLEEGIDEEQLVEHVDIILGLIDRLSNINEGEEDVDEIIDQTLSELLFPEEDEEDQVNEDTDEDEEE